MISKVSSQSNHSMILWIRHQLLKVQPEIMISVNRTIALITVVGVVHIFASFKDYSWHDCNNITEYSWQGKRNLLKTNKTKKFFPWDGLTPTPQSLQSSLMFAVHSIQPHVVKQADLGRGSRPSLAAQVVFPCNPPCKRGLSLPQTEENMKHLNGWARWLCTCRGCRQTWP